MLPYKLMVCKNCTNSKHNSARLSTNEIYRKLHEVQCGKCNTMWLVCVFHNKRYAYRSFFLAQKHIVDIDHSLCVPITKETSSDADDEDFEVHNDNNYSCKDTESSTTNTNINTIKSFEACFSAVSLSQYNTVMRRFIESESSSTGDGLKRIVACAFAMNMNAIYSELSFNEMMYHMKATSFCLTLTATQLSQYYELSHMLGTTFNPSFNGDDNKILQTRPPSSAIDIDRYYLNRSTSIATNIPIPTVHHNHGHAFVSIKEAVQHFLCFETDIDGMFIDKVSSSYKNMVRHNSTVTNSKICNDIRLKVKSSLSSSNISPLILYLIIWSDDFEPNHVKQFKKSTWIKTITISAPQHCQTSSRHTYVIALSKKENNHDIVNAFFNRELKELQVPTEIYCKVTNCNLPIVVETLAISADRPERSALNCMLGHNGLPSRRWRFSAYIDPDKLKACTQCMLRRIHLLDSGHSHKNNRDKCCYDWNYQHSRNCSNLPKDYPVNQHPDSPPPPIGREVSNIKYLYPIELTYDILKQAVKFCFFNCYRNNWTQTEAMVYLKSVGINEKYGKENVFLVAQKLKKMNTLERTSCYDYISYPILWCSGLQLNQCIDTPMHQIFQGVVKSLMDETITWLNYKKNPIYKEFGEYVNGTLCKFHDVGVDWCRMEKFTSGRLFSLGGWQAEQFIAFARCSIIVYSAIRDLVPNEEVGLNEHECMIQSLLCLVSRLMCSNSVSYETLLEYTKHFLSVCDAFENTAFKLEGIDPFWYKKGNFLSLLNLPDQIQRYGNLKNYWEGSRERSIQLIKPFLINMRATSSFYRRKLNRMYISQTIERLNKDTTEHFALQENIYQERPSYERYLSFKVYSSRIDLKAFILHKNVLSTILVKDDLDQEQHFVVTKNATSANYSLFQIVFRDEEGFNKCGMWYAPIKIIIDSELEYSTLDLINDMVLDYALLCPCISKHTSLSCCYTAITKEWRYRNEDGIHNLPTISKQFTRSILNTEH